MIQNKAPGFTFIELMVTLAICSILFLFCSQFSTILSAINNECDTHRLFNTLTFARGAAIKGNHLIIVCPTIDKMECSQDWSTGYMVFFQPSHSQEPIKLLRYEKNSHLTTIRSLSTPLIQFTGEGRSLQRTTFHLNTQNPSKIVVYDSGRIRLSAKS